MKGAAATKVRDIVGQYLNPPEAAVSCASMRNRRSRHSTARRPCCRCCPGYRSAAATIKRSEKKKNEVEGGPPLPSESALGREHVAQATRATRDGCAGACFTLRARGSVRAVASRPRPSRLTAAR